jgi:hypothetical protein
MGRCGGAVPVAFGGWMFWRGAGWTGLFRTEERRILDCTPPVASPLALPSPVILESAALLALCSTPAGAAGYAGFLSWRGRRRNQRELCADCGGPQYTAPKYEPPALVQGRTVCAPCAERQRRRLRIVLGAAGALTGVAVIGATTAAAMGTTGWLVPLAVAGEYVGLFAGALGWMKRRNHKARAALHAGMDPLFRLDPAPADPSA